jgi:hypothetical protein
MFMSSAPGFIVHLIGRLFPSRAPVFIGMAGRA